MSEENRDQLREDLVISLIGSCKSINEIAQQFNVNEDLAEELISNAEIELCPCCGWWEDETEFTEIDGENICQACNMDTIE